MIAADPVGRVNYLNPVAEKLTGWTLADAAGEEIERVFRIVHETRVSRPTTGPEVIQLEDKLIEHRQYIDKHGVDMPEIRNWKWTVPAATRSPEPA